MIALLFAVASASSAVAVDRVHAVCLESSLFDQPGVTYVTGPNPHFMVTGDFNADGRVDLAVTNADLPTMGGVASSVAVLLGAGGGTFGPPTLYPVGDEPHGIAAADFDHDGILDLVTANKFGANVSVLLGQGSGGVGDGTFGPAAHFPAGGYGFQVEAADFDGDGVLDLAVSLNSVAAVGVLIGQGSGGAGDGTFAAPVLVPITQLSTGLEVGDFNGDGILDLVATENNAGSVGVLLGLGSGGVGDGTFAPVVRYGAGPQPFDLTLGDFNDDGVTDLAVANTAYGGTAVLIGAGDGSFTLTQIVPSGNTAAVVAFDANGDGITDLVSGEFIGNHTGRVKLYLGQGAGGVGSGTFGGESVYSIGADAYQFTARDLDGDGSQDLIVAAALFDYVSVLRGVCQPQQADPRKPVLTGVRDVPNDEGGRVFLTWTRSSLDVTGGPVNAYRVWRRIPPSSAAWAAAAAAEAPSTRLLAIARNASDATEIDYWEALVTLPAQRLAGYGYTAPTTQDSMRSGNPYTAFFVTALTADFDVFHASDVDSGYSVDNLPPFGPHGVAGALEAGGLRLTWEASDASDFDLYRVYRGETAEFGADEGSLIATTTSTEYLDEGAPGLHFYKLSVVDTHGNESETSTVPPVAPAGAGAQPRATLALQGARPNPSRGGALTVSFTLPRPGSARIEIVDVGGRVALARVLSGLAAGSHAVSVAEAGRLSPGVYLVRLRHEGRTLERKAVVTR